MRKVIGGLCCLIVASQILVGVPLAVCCAFFLVARGGGVGPLVVEWHASARPSATIAPADYPPPPLPSQMSTASAVAPPRNIIPATAPPSDHPILQTRQSQGCPLVGTVLETCQSPQEEQELFVAALEKAALACADEPGPQLVELNPDITSVCDAAQCIEACPFTTAERPNGKASVLPLLSHLYEMASFDEQAGEYDRADQWRALARELRRKSANESQ